jgi:hypothetical protein
MTYTKTELYEKFQNLPEEIQDAFLSVDTYQNIKKIVDKYKLHIDQSGKLSEEIGFVMLGVTRPEDFLGSIQQKLGISTETAGEIVKDINTSIFFPIRTELEALNNGGATKYQNERRPLVENFSPAGQISRENIIQPQTPLQNPDNNAIIIDREVKNNEPRSDRQIFDEKMGKLFRLPKEEIELGSVKRNPAEQSVTQKPVDPYREVLK